MKQKNRFYPALSMLHVACVTFCGCSSSLIVSFGAEQRLSPSPTCCRCGRNYTEDRELQALPNIRQDASISCHSGERECLCGLTFLHGPGSSKEQVSRPSMCTPELHEGLFSKLPRANPVPMQFSMQIPACCLQLFKVKLDFE